MARGRKKINKPKRDKRMMWSHVKKLVSKQYSYGEKRSYFKTKQERNEFARDVYDWYSQKGEKVTISKLRGYVKETIGVERKKKKAEGTIKEIFDDVLIQRYLDRVPYYELNDMVDAIATFRKVNIYSPMTLPSGMVLIGGVSYRYEETFKPFVDYLNELNVNRVSGLSDFYVRLVFESAEYDKKTDRWNVELISCDTNSKKEDYGFNPLNPSNSKLDDDKIKDRIETEQNIPRTIEEKVDAILKEERKEEGKPTEIAETQKQVQKIEVEKQKRTANIDILMKKKESIMQDMKLYKELDEKDLYEEAKKDYIAITKQIKAIETIN